ncbi:COG4223 family protein [Ensifer sp. HO-A22]|uniref:COG4223 family protein n=1 Tax=Ensifer oleiphilus TaxID=2742698 RepID=A0A7Y6UNY0_9HYPH|nr:COG4223 family protein [Ensifer oleiphilus]NVD40921.1 COG4223 family protein [Ensifer oleiphilus]
MVSENPPRRSKAEKEPLTIDLEAEKSVTENAEATASHAAAADEPTEPPEVDGAAEARLEEEIEEQRADAAAAVFTEEPPHISRTPEATVVQKPPSSAGALAAGILGGLVTLAGFGVLQYAGYIPGLGPDRGASTTELTLSSEVQALRDQVAGIQAPAATIDIAPLENRLAALEQAGPDAGGAPAAEMTALQAEVTNLTKEIAALKSGLADAQQSATAARAELASRIDTAEQKLNEPANDIQVAKAVAVTALKSAIDRGGPFLAELDALRSIAPEEKAVTELSQDATTGVATRADLRRDFATVADTMLDTLNQPDPKEGIFDRLVSSAMSGIRVRPVGSVEGDTPEAVVARIEDKLNNGDLKGAALEWDALPAAAKTAGEAFKVKLDQRLRVEGIIDAAVAATMNKTATEG